MSFLFVIGLLVILYGAFHAVDQYRRMAKMSQGEPAWPETVKKYGGWAVVTGCTDGIGKQYCLAMAQHIDK